MHDVLQEVDIPHNMIRDDFEACIELEMENENLHQSDDEAHEIDEEDAEVEVASQVQTVSLKEALTALRVLQNWGQQDGLPDIPFAMDELLKIENGLVRRKFEANKVQKKKYRFLLIETKILTIVSKN